MEYIVSGITHLALVIVIIYLIDQRKKFDKFVRLYKLNNNIEMQHITNITVNLYRYKKERALEKEDYRDVIFFDEQIQRHLDALKDLREEEKHL